AVGRRSGWLSGWLPSWSPTSNGLLKVAEEKVLQCLKSKWVGRYVDVLDEDRLWSITVTNPELERSGTADTSTPLVLVHGFGGGVGLWALNLDSMARRRRVHAFDLLETGRRGDPVERRGQPFDQSHVRASSECGVIKPSVSLGVFVCCYLCVCVHFRVKQLILVDPWGFPERPLNPDQERPVPMWVKAIGFVLSPFNPLAGLRAAGPWAGPGMVQRFRPDFKRKFSNLFDDDTICEYIYHCNAQTPSGETAFKAMTIPYGWAKRPMLHRIGDLDPAIPIAIIYGARSWIDSSSGGKVVEARPGSRTRLVQIRGAGHHVYADQPEDFNKMVEQICDSID
uniref:Abhydrolase domain containing 5, lysophosphatidic acid acyltransferase n=1 Tax=Petromyzon marinus TaxID=7757 RepID=S4RF33_PETMA